MTTNEIIDILFGESKELHKTSKGYKCYFSLYKCNLTNNDVHNLFEFKIDKTFSFGNPNVLICIPEGEVIEIYKHEEKYNYDQLKCLLDIFPADTIKRYGEELTYIVFAVLHEVGHWEYICNNHYSPQEYEEKDFAERKLVFESKAEKDSKEVFCEYRKITSEKEADKYAMAELNVALESIVNSKKNEDE